MNRKIRFRGQICAGLANAGQWIYWGIAGTDLIDVIDPETIGQFTGLCDKDGKPIYEGDIVTYSPSHINLSERCAVEYRGSGYAPFQYDGGGEFDSDDCEVIGNIFENEELLK